MATRMSSSGEMSLTSSLLTVVDLDRNEAYHFEGSNSTHSGGHQHEVLEMLGTTQQAGA